MGGGSSTGRGGSARGPTCGGAPPRPAYAPTPQVQGRASTSPVTEAVDKPGQGAASAANQPTAQPGPMQVPPAAREFATFYRQSVCVQQLQYDPTSMKLMQTICCAMGIPDPLTAVQDAAEQAMAHWCSMALQMSQSSEGASLQQVLAKFVWDSLGVTFKFQQKPWGKNACFQFARFVEVRWLCRASKSDCQGNPGSQWGSGPALPALALLRAP